MIVQRLHLEDRQENEDPETSPSPPTVGSYLLPLLLVIFACAGYLFWRRRQRPIAGFSLQIPSTAPSAVRLSMDDDGPASQSFISNNASTDSLPTHALQDLPVLSRTPSAGSSASQQRQPSHQGTFSKPAPSYISPRPFPRARFGPLGRRRTQTQREPVERDDELDDSDESEDGAAAGEMFGIGDEDGEEDGGKTQRDKG